MNCQDTERKHNAKDTRLEKGQSLVEFVIIIPLFFVILSGINLYLNQEIKSLTEDSAYDSLLITDAHFDDAERIQSQWNAAPVNTLEYNRSILKNAFNPSQYFNHSVDLNNGVFQDKKTVVQKSQTSCDQNPSYQLHSSQSGQFKFESCADGSGFESANFLFEDIFENFKSTTAEHQGESLYYPNADFSWNQRERMAVNAVKRLELMSEGQMFRTQYASLKLPVDSAQFNSKCLMNAGRADLQKTGIEIQFTQGQMCSIPTLIGKWTRAAYDGANTQIFECFAEMSANCLKTVAPLAVAACVAVGTVEIESALMSGNRASVCPILNNVTAFLYNDVILTSKGLSLKTSAQEAIERRFFLF